MKEKENRKDNKSIATIKKFPLMNINPGGVGEALKENLGGECLSTFDLQRVSFPTGGNLTWSLDNYLASEEVQEKEIIGIPIHQRNSRACWAEDFSGEGTSPDCSSPDGIRGAGNPGGPCLSCPNNEFGSKGRGKSCKEFRELFILREESILPLVISVPPSSLKAVHNLFLNLGARGIKMYQAVISFGLKAEKNLDGIKYSKLNPQFLYQIPSEQSEKIKNFRDSFITAFVTNKLSDEGSDEPIDHPWEEAETSQDDGDSTESDDLPF